MPGIAVHPWQTNVPGALSALVSLVSANVARAGSTALVKDGPWLSQETNEQIICIGWPGFQPGYEYPSRSMSEELGGPAVTSSAVQTGLLPAYLETFQIMCASLCRTGDRSVPEARTIAYANMSLVGTVIADLVSSQFASKATMGTEHALHQTLTRKGVDVVVTFSVEVQAWSQ